MKVTKLVLHQVAGFEQETFEFPEGCDPEKADVHILVGPNGTGKTTALMALAQAFSNSPTGLAQRFRGSDSGVLIELGDAIACCMQPLPRFGQSPVLHFAALKNKRVLNKPSSILS